MYVCMCVRGESLFDTDSTLNQQICTYIQAYIHMHAAGYTRGTISIYMYIYTYIHTRFLHTCGTTSLYIYIYIYIYIYVFIHALFSYT